MFSQTLCKQIKSSYSSFSPNTRLYPLLCSPLPSCTCGRLPSSHVLVTPALQSCPVVPGTATSECQRLWVKQTECPQKGPGPWFPTGEVNGDVSGDGWSRAVAGTLGNMEMCPLSFAISPTGVTRALASLCNSRNKAMVGFCSNSWALSCSLVLLCELHWSCSHCCRTEASSFSPSTQMLMVRAEMNLCPRPGRKTRKTDLPYFSTWTRNRDLALSAKFCVIDAGMITCFCISKTADNAVSYSWVGKLSFFFFLCFVSFWS